MRSHFQTVFLALGAALLTTPIARAEITKFVNDFDGWQTAAGSFTTVDFVENAPSAPVLFDHFIDYGVLLHRPGSFNPAIPYWGRFTSLRPSPTRSGSLRRFMHSPISPSRQVEATPSRYTSGETLWRMCSTRGSPSGSFVGFTRHSPSTR